MHVQLARGAIAVWRATPPPAHPPVILRGRGLLAARLALLAFAALALCLDATTLAWAWQTRGATMFAGDLSPEQLRAALAGTGLTPGGYLALAAAAQLLRKLTFYAAAFVLLRRRSAEVIALLVVAFLVASTAAGFPPELFALMATEPVRATLHLAITFVFPVSFVWLFFLFPDGRFRPRWTIPLAAFWALQIAWDFFVVRAIGSNGPLADAATFALVLVAIVAAQAHRYRRVSGPVERQQTKWFLGGLGVAFLTFAAGNVYLGANGLLVPDAPPERAAIPWLIFTIANTLAGLCVAGALAVAVLRYRLFAIDVILNRALVYGGLTAAVIGLYVLIVGYLGALFRTGGSLPISLVATGVVAVLFQPLRDWLQRGANRLLYGERDEPYAVISRLGRRLEGTLPPDAILPTIVETVAGALKLPYAAIALGQGAGRAVVAATGTPTPDPLRLPLAYRGEAVGELLLAPRAPGEDFSPADLRLLADLARQAGVAARAVRLADEARALAADLQASRERLVLAREEERRRLRRDLHDGLGPRLAALTLRLDTARDVLADDPRADALLADLAARTAEAVADIRPPGLRPAPARARRPGPGRRAAPGGGGLRAGRAAHRRRGARAAAPSPPRSRSPPTASRGRP